MGGDRIRFGVLGAAKIAPDALIKPAADSERAEVVAIAARDPERARRFAEEHGIPQVEAAFCVPISDPEDIRYDLSLGGGATMDLGCYPIHWARLVTGTEPSVVRAEAREGPSGIDLTMTAEMRFPGETRCAVRCSMAPDTGFQAFLQVTGSGGEPRADNPLVPHLVHRLRVSGEGGEEIEQLEGQTTYHRQLDAFVAAVTDGEGQPTGGQDAVDNMRVIDAVYLAAGMQPRGE